MDKLAKIIKKIKNVLARIESAVTKAFGFLLKQPRSKPGKPRGRWEKVKDALGGLFGKKPEKQREIPEEAIEMRDLMDYVEE